MSTRIPLHHNSSVDSPWVKRATQIVDLWTTMAMLNPKGFRTPRQNKGRGKPPLTRLEQIAILDNKLA